MRIPANQTPESAPLPSALLDFIAPVALLAIVTLLYFLHAPWPVWALSAAFIVLLEVARQRSRKAELVQTKEDERTAIARAAQSLRPPVAAPPEPEDRSGG